MEETKTENNVQYYEIYGQRMIPVEKFKYSLPDIQMENISDGIRDDYLRTAILNPNELKGYNDDEREALLTDLALLENTSSSRDETLKSQ